MTSVLAAVEKIQFWLYKGRTGIALATQVPALTEGTAMHTEPKAYPRRSPKGCSPSTISDSLAQASLSIKRGFPMEIAPKLARPPASLRHCWSQPSRPTEHLTVRTCLRCGMRKLTRHDGGVSRIPWYEFQDEHGTLIDFGGTPPCEPCRPEEVA